MILGSLAIIYGFWWLFFSDATSDVKPSDQHQTLEESRRSIARAFCNRVILKNLKDPTSAQTGPLSDGFYGLWPAKNISDNRVKVTARFRAKNSFGALVRTQFTCVLRFDGPNVVGVETLSEQ